MDRVETAFRKFDIDGDGFVDWEEFQEMTKNMEPEQAKRIFNSCDKVSPFMFPFFRENFLFITEPLFVCFLLIQKGSLSNIIIRNPLGLTSLLISTSNIHNISMAARTNV